ncbi:MAG: hypothetical protein QM601_13850 [Pseudoxanthomonas sp.]
MSALPPPLPASRPSPPPGSRLVTALGWVTVVLGALGAAQELVQALVSLAVPGGALAGAFAPYGGPPPQLPPILQWYLQHGTAMGMLGLAISVLLTWIGLDLVRRRPWARPAFIAYLALGTVMMLATVATLPALMQAIVEAQFAQAGLEAPAELQDVIHAYAVLVMAMCGVFALLHAWLAWKLCTPAIRAEFRAAGR